MKFFNFFKKKSSKPVAPMDKSPMENNSVPFDSTEQKIAYHSDTTLSDVLQFIKNNAFKVGIQLNKPATNHEIETFEKQKTKLPADFKMLYTFSNGFETDHDQFRLIPLDEAAEDRLNKSYLISKRSFHFTEYMIYSDMWSVDVSHTNVNEYKIYNKAETVVYLTNSLAEFLCVFINKGVYDGLYEWMERKEQA